MREFVQFFFFRRVLGQCSVLYYQALNLDSPNSLVKGEPLKIPYIDCFIEAKEEFI